MSAKTPSMLLHLSLMFFIPCSAGSPENLAANDSAVSFLAEEAASYCGKYCSIASERTDCGGTCGLCDGYMCTTGIPPQTRAPTTTTKKSAASFCGLPCTPATWETDCGGSCGLCDGVMCSAGYAPTTTTALASPTETTATSFCGRPCHILSERTDCGGTCGLCDGYRCTTGSPVPTRALTTTTEKIAASSFCGRPCQIATESTDCGGSCGLCDGQRCTSGLAPTTTLALTTSTKKSAASFCGLPCTPATWETDCGGSCGLCDGVMCSAGYAPTTTTALTTGAETTATQSLITTTETTAASFCGLPCTPATWETDCGGSCGLCDGVMCTAGYAPTTTTALTTAAETTTTRSLITTTETTAASFCGRPCQIATESTDCGGSCGLCDGQRCTSGSPPVALTSSSTTLAAAVTTTTGGAVPIVSKSVSRCEFDSTPIDVGFYWDATCEKGKPGCYGDGKHVECRLCGGGEFIQVPCPASSCTFDNEPYVPYYWDTECKLGMSGCWADGVHVQCRFCGAFPHTGVPCPEGTALPRAAACAFENKPETPYYWDPSCTMGMHGCHADGAHVHCRFCGGGGFADIHCPGTQVCAFGLEPTVPYYWDPDCREGMLGCKADGVHTQCRFCAERPFESVACPAAVFSFKEGVCTWPQRGEPKITYFWDETCKTGMLGCWADGIHAQCRFCGMGVFSAIPCPKGTSSEPSNMSPQSLRR